MNYRKQKYAACKLISAINARIYLGRDDVTEDEFERLVDIAKCRYGAAINIFECYPILGLSYTDGPLKDMPLEWVKNHLPVEIGYNDPKFGFHSALIVGVEDDEVLAINASWDKMKWYDIYFYPHEYNRTLRSFKYDS